MYIPQTNESWSNELNTAKNNLLCSKLVLNLLREYRTNDKLNELNTSNWFLLSDADNHFLVRILKSRNVYSGAWTNLDYLSSAFDSFAEMGAIILYVDEEGNCIGNPEFEDKIIDSKKSLETPYYYRHSPTQKYLAVSEQLDFCDYYITVLIPNNYIFAEFASLYGLMFFILIWLFLLSVSLIILMTYFFKTPSRILNPVITSMRNGQFATLIETEYEFQEIQDITDTFNDMIGEIQNLRIHIYEEQLTKKELELQYLKSQIAPHFLINCLNTIFVLSEDQTSQDIILSIITTLSEHLRYTLATRNSVSLEEELYYVENYLKLTQLRFPNTLQYDIQIENNILNAKVFPLILLMLTENSVKTNVVMGESLLIQIRGYCYEYKEQVRIHLTHIDSGIGFDENYLELYNHITDHPEIHEKGRGIGLYNTAMRLNLTFNESAHIEFSNEPGLGARVDIDFPYFAYEQEELPQ